MKSLVDCASIGIRLPESVAREVDALHATLPQECKNYHRKSLIPTDVTFEPGERADISVLTTATPDKTNEIVLPEGVDMDSYRRSGVVLYNHDTEKIVGNCQWIKHYPRDNSIRAKTTYFENEDGVESKWYQFVDETWHMVKAGALRGKSIGFQPLKPLRDPTEDELQVHPEWKGCGVWESVLLLEYSCCPIGMNNDALVEVVNTKSVSSEVLQAMGIEQPTMPEPPLWEGHKSDECVSKKIKLMYDQAIAFAHCHGKRLTKPAKKKSLDQLLAEKIAQIDVDRLVQKALEQHRNRGRV